MKVVDNYFGGLKNKYIHCGREVKGKLILKRKTIRNLIAYEG